VEPDDDPLLGSRVGFATPTVIVVAAPAAFVEVVTSVTIEGAVVVGCPALFVVVIKMVLSNVVLQEMKIHE
jgi:hypothetical protein